MSIFSDADLANIRQRAQLRLDVERCFREHGRVVAKHATEPRWKLMTHSVRGGPSGVYQVTSIDADGPSGHREYMWLRDATNEFIGYVINVERSAVVPR